MKYGIAVLTYVLVAFFPFHSLKMTEYTLLDGTNVRLNWNIESDMNVYWI